MLGGIGLSGGHLPHGGGQQVRPTIPIKISDSEGPRFVHVGIDDPSGPFAIQCCITGMFVPRNDMCTVRGGRCIQISITIQINQDHVISSGTVVSDQMTLPGFRAVAARIGQPDQVAFLVVHNRHVRRTVAVNISNHMALEPARFPSKKNLTFELSVPVVTEQVQGRHRFVLDIGAREIHITVPIKVGSCHSKHITQLAGQKMFGKPGWLFSTGRLFGAG